MNYPHPSHSKNEEHYVVDEARIEGDKIHLSIYEHHHTDDIPDPDSTSLYRREPNFESFAKMVLEDGLGELVEYNGIKFLKMTQRDASLYEQQLETGEFFRLKHPQSVAKRTRHKVQIALSSSLKDEELDTIRKSHVYVYGAANEEIPLLKWFLFQEKSKRGIFGRAFPSLEGDLGAVYSMKLEDMTPRLLEWVLRVPPQWNSNVPVGTGYTEGWEHTRFYARRLLGRLDQNEEITQPIDWTCGKC